MATKKKPTLSELLSKNEVSLTLKSSHDIAVLSRGDLLEAAAISIAAGTMHRVHDFHQESKRQLTASDAADIYEAALLQARMVLSTVSLMLDKQTEIKEHGRD